MKANNENTTVSGRLSGGEPDWAAVRKLFPVVEHCTWLKNCAASPISRPVSDAMTRYALRYATEGKYKDDAKVKDVRGKVARLLGATEEEIAFTQNTVVAINTIARGIRWQEGDNVVLANAEFPANYYPWHALLGRGVKVRAIPLDEDGRIPLERLIGAFDRRTRVVAVSSVQFTNGFRTNLAALGQACRQRGIYLSVDAVQEIGCIPMNVRDQHIDFLQAGSHKWLFGPIGTGFLYCRRELLDELDVAFVGHDSMVERAEYLPYAWELKSTASRFEPGVQNHSGLAGLDAALDLLDNLGVATIWRRVKHLTDYLVNRLVEIDCAILSPRGPGEASGIVLFQHSRVPAGELVRILEQERILTSERSGGVRVGPAFYNNHEDIDRLISVVERATGGIRVLE